MLLCMVYGTHIVAFLSCLPQITFWHIHEIYQIITITQSKFCFALSFFNRTTWNLTMLQDTTPTPRLPPFWCDSACWASSICASGVSCLATEGEQSWSSSFQAEAADQTNFAQTKPCRSISHYNFALINYCTLLQRSETAVQPSATVVQRPETVVQPSATVVQRPKTVVQPSATVVEAPIMELQSTNLPAPL